MLASRVLPPILRTPPPPAPPVATFFNIPRRYVKSNMQVGDNASRSPTEDVQSPRTLRKSSRIHELRSASTSSPVQRTKEQELPSSDSSSPTSGKKRVASYDEVNGAETVDGDSPTDPRPPPSASSTGSGELSGSVCLCQPEPKIPRPRNAFILYRQHHQHAIVARNPRLANPEISKIVGEQWKAESDEQKKVWQDLAQEEKARHHQQYPDYRYQPRRLGKPGSLPLNPSGQHTTVDKYRCPRCGGRSIKTPTSPFLSANNTPLLPPPNVSEGLTPTTRYLPMMSNLSLESPAHRRGPGPSSLSNIQVTSAAREDATMYSPLTPELKRRRYNNYATVTNGRRPEASYYSSGLARRDSLPPIHMRPSPPNTATMPPPRTPRDVRRGSVDLNVLVTNQHDQSRSVEAMVMSVPFPVKIKVLGRITPPLKDPGPTSPAIQVRGAIIAVEGDDAAAVGELTGWLNNFLAKDKEYSPRIAEPPKGPAANQKEVSFEDYLDLIKEWHGKSKEMIQYITTSLRPPASDSESEKKDPKGKKEDTQMKSPSLSPKPVVILPTYQLRASDAYASKIPIQDVYSPMDHWQWMATLWRGTVGPDLTIYVKSADKDSSAGSGIGGKLVELNDEVRCLTVQREKEGRFAEAALRRVGFEVSEWVRSVSVGGSGKSS
ncbi:hypothetical protein BU26DRAFT_39295 [Trematosphaeria pertusa]|uniref:HMG box domain-containing protein n=1 Tax=Trematosphaeria pertusa TaxID=390896 RepID=A0A6A6J496_9PLEO|nr:uncharacterized protein BU26DRAFT_39295 [Trematosphaeria pertusa]KAF2257241.1 hypothetical protein BU26DRAFT_39295 [Trematosphaeria pertusa]